jgi:hypothetical protein
MWLLILWHICSSYPINTIDALFLLCFTVTPLLGYSETTKYLEQQIFIFGTWNLKNTKRSFIFMTCMWVYTVVQTVYVYNGFQCSVHAQNKYMNNYTYRNIGELLCKVVIKFADLYEHWNGLMMFCKSLCCHILGDLFGDFQAVM